MNSTFRNAVRADVPLILTFIKELAAYEKMTDEVVATEALLEEWLFEQKKAEVIFALEGDCEVGFALFFHNFSTFLGRAGLYLEDLYVRPEYQGRGIGQAYFIAPGPDCGGAEMGPPGVVVPGLEPEQHRFLSGDGGGAHVGLDGLPHRRGDTNAAGRPHGGGIMATARDHLYFFHFIDRNLVI